MKFENYWLFNFAIKNKRYLFYVNLREFQMSQIAEAIKLKFGEFSSLSKISCESLTKRYFAIFVTEKSPFRREFRASPLSIVKKFLNDA